MIQGLIHYGRSARKVLGGLFDGRSSDWLVPGDLVKHQLWEGSWGVLVAKVSDDSMTVLWTKAPGLRRQQLDRMDDDIAYSANPCGEVLLEESGSC